MLFRAAQIGLLIAFLPMTALAQAATGSIVGSVADGQANPLTQVTVTIDGPVKQSVVTDATGAFTVSGLPPGLYAISAARTGYGPASRSDVVVTNGAPTPVTIQMQSLSLSTLNVIGHVSTSTRGRINVSPEAITTMSGSTFIDQGQTSVTQALNQIPGYTGTLDSAGIVLGGYNNASGSLGQVPQLRGALPYETATLIDGHPVSLGTIGFYNPRFLSPYILQDVEVAKGPGAMPANVSGAIGGTVNFVTLQPTAAFKYSADFGVDSYGGQSSNIRATGTTLNSKLGFVVDAALTGSPGPLNNYATTLPYLPTFFGGVTINGVNCPGQCGHLPGPPLPGWGDGFTESSSIIATGFTANTNSFIRNELFKARYSFSPATILTLSYLATQATVNEGGNYSYTMPNEFFTPPSGYTGAVPAGVIPCCWTAELPYYEYNYQGLFTADISSTLTKSLTFLGRYYRTEHRR